MDKNQINTVVKELVRMHKAGEEFNTKKEGAGWNPGAWEGVGHDRENRVNVTDINKIVKKVVKNVYPDVKLSARKDHGGYHDAITVEVVECDTHIIKYTYTEEEKSGNWPPHAREYTEKGKAVMGLIKNVLAYFNKNNSDSMTDYFEVGFYSYITHASNLGKDIVI